MEYPKDLRYSREHTWARVEGDTCYVGITYYAQDQLGEIVYVDLPDVGDALEQMDTFGTVESVKAVNDLLSPVSGEVADVNKALEDEPEVVNSDPYGDGWMIAISINNEDDLDELMSASEYKEMVKEEE